MTDRETPPTDPPDDGDQRPQDAPSQGGSPQDRPPGNQPPETDAAAPAPPAAPADDERTIELVSREGVSDEERAEIQEQIDQVATESKIKVEPERFLLRNIRAGSRFPILVNGAAVVAIALGVLLLSGAFRSGERAIVGQSLEYQSIEGRLIAELRRESQQRLLSKEQEIAQIRSRLSQLEGELSDFEATVEERVTQRESDLAQQLAADVRAERARLVETGVDATRLDRLLATFEAERRAFYEQQLDVYREELNQERLALERDIERLRVEFNDQLQQLRRERDEIVSDYQNREEDLRQRLQQRTAVLERAQATTTESLASAQQELAALQLQRERSTQVQDQVLGQFANIRAALRADDSELAAQRIAQLRSYLGQESVVALRDLASRREIDLFVLDALEQLLADRVRGDAQAQNISGELRLLARLRNSAAQAASASAAGDGERALTLYGQVVNAMPQVSEAHTVLREAAVDGLQASIDAEQAQVDAAFAALVARATAAVAQARYVDALQLYRDAFAGVAATEPLEQQLVPPLARLGYGLVDYTAGAANTAVPVEPPQALAALATQAGIDLVDERLRFGDTIAQAVRNRELILEGQIAAVDSELNDLRDERDRQLAALQSEQNQELAAVTAERERRIAELEDRQQELVDELEDQAAADLDDARRAAEERLRSRVAELQGTIDQLRSDLSEQRASEQERIAAARESITDQLQGQLDTQNAELERRSAQIQQLNGQIRTLQTEQSRLEREVARLEEFERLTESIQSEYQRYVEAASNIGATGPEAVLEAKFLLESFLTLDQVAGLMPDIAERVRGFDQQFEQAGREAALLDVLDIMDQFASMPNAQQQLAFLNAENARAQDDPVLLELLAVLRELAGS